MEFLWYKLINHGDGVYEPLENTFSRTHQSDKEVVKNKIDSHQRSESLPSVIHGQMHDFIPSFLSQNLEHGHDGLPIVTTATEGNKEKKVRVSENSGGVNESGII